MKKRTAHDFVTDRMFDVEKVNEMERKSPHWLRAKAQANHMPYCVDYITGCGYPFVIRQREQLRQNEKVAALEQEILKLNGWNEVFE